MLLPSRQKGLLNSAHVHPDTQPEHAGATADHCPSYDEDRFRRQPSAMQGWWDQQKKRDAKEADQGSFITKNWYAHRDNQTLWPKKAPRYVVYTCCANDSDVSADLPAADELTGINVLVLAFLGLKAPTAKVQGYFNKSLEDRRKYVESLHDRGIALMMSVFGGDDSEQPTSKGYDPVALGKLHGQIARHGGFDGLDNDWEDFAVSDYHRGQDRTAVEWLVRYTRAVRSEMPRGSHALSAAPVPNWFSDNTTSYCSGMWRSINQQVGHEYDWYNVQYYNQNRGSYDTCQTMLFHSNTSTHSHTSVFELHTHANVTLDKIVIGKPGNRADADGGYMTPERLSHCAKMAHDKGWNGGFMAWQYPHADSQWFQTVQAENDGADKLGDHQHNHHPVVSPLPSCNETLIEEGAEHQVGLCPEGHLP
ncbi:unnamed protein product [Parajaminaea phylloscopi]